MIAVSLYNIFHNAELCFFVSEIKLSSFSRKELGVRFQQSICARLSISFHSSQSKIKDALLIVNWRQS